MASETKQERDIRIGKLCKAYLDDGDNSAGNDFILQFDALIRRTVLDYFYLHLDLQLGYSVDDVMQQSRIKILASLKHFDRDKSSYAHFICHTTIWTCNRMVRFTKSLMRDYRRQAELKDDYILALEDTRLKTPAEIAIENELFGVVQMAVSTLPPVCQAIYEVLMDGRESAYNSTHPCLKGKSGCNISNPTKRLRNTVKRVMESYLNDYQPTNST